MPELPEVQTIVDDLNKKVRGCRITGVWFDWPKTIGIVFADRRGLLRGSTQKSKQFKKILEKIIKGKEILGVRRRAKNILIYLQDTDQYGLNRDLRGHKKIPYKSVFSPFKSASHVMLIHLKMTGHLLVGKWSIRKAQPSPARRARGTRKRPHEYKDVVVPLEPKEAVEDPYNQYVHLIFYLDPVRSRPPQGGRSHSPKARAASNGVDNWKMLAFSDLRKFGKVILGTKEQIENLPELKKLGPEPLDKSFKFIKFVKLIKSEKRKIKQVLMDQEVIAGIGNIYSDDILWMAKIHPFKPANKLSERELKELWKAMRQILTKALKLRGTSISDYRDTAGKEGEYTEERLVYQREGEPCQRCKTKIKRVKIGGRSAHFCPACQRLN